MSTSHFSRLMIAQGLKALLKTESLETISIGDIAKQCQVSRSTIYYHFKDKYDIVSWIFEREITPIVSQYRAVGDWTENLLAVFLYLQENKDFYIKVLRDDGQNSFREYLTDYCRYMIVHMFQQSQGDRVLQPNVIQTTADIYSYGLVGIITNWSRGGMAEDPRPVVSTVKALISGDVFARMRSLSQD